MNRTGRGPAWSPEDDAAILRGLADGKTNVAIAEQLGRTQNAVNNRVSIMRRHGVNIEVIKAAARAARLGKQQPAPLLRVPRAQQRKCLCCGGTFGSAGAHNRLCVKCRAKNASPFAPGARV